MPFDTKELGSEDLGSQQVTALYASAFFDELWRWGVREAVVSPGSRSTALAMVALEMRRRWPDRLRLYVDVDERGASFLALGLAKASGRPVCLICTSGTAMANYYPAVVEAETSRVPLVILSADRPLFLQGLGAPQTCDQIKAYGSHVRHFRQMPLPLPGVGGPLPRADFLDSVAFARQAAREACLAALGSGAGVPRGEAGGEEAVASRGCAYEAGPVHLNFPLDEPLKPDLSVRDLFSCGRRTRVEGVPELVPFERADPRLGAEGVARICSLMEGRRTLALAGEGSCETEGEARELVAWARARGIPLLADPLSGLRSLGDSLVIDNYDNMLGGARCSAPEVVIRFGRYPVSKRCTQYMAAAQPVNIVVDVAETRDFNRATDVFVPCTPLSFVRSFREHCGGKEQDGALANGGAEAKVSAEQASFAQEWVGRNDAERESICVVGSDDDGAEGAYVRALLQLAPSGSCLFSASSLAVRTLDTFYVKDDKRLAVLCNRGQNGIDGTVSTAIGAAQHFSQTTLLTGDLALLHDVNALALQRELLLHHGGQQAPSIVVVLFNNNGGGIFDTLPQKSSDAYFERLFITPQDVRFADIARSFGVPYCRPGTVVAFSEAYQAFLETPGISMIEVELPYEGVHRRYARYQQGRDGGGS